MLAPARRLWTLLALGVVFGTMMAAAPGFADPGEDKQRVDEQLSQASATMEHATARAQEAIAAVASANEQLPAAQLAIDQAQGRVIAAQVEATEAQREAEEAQRKLDTAEEQFQQAEAGVAAEQKTFDAFVRESYSGGYYLSAAAVLSVQGPESLVAALEYLETLAHTRDDAVDHMRAARVVEAEERATVTGYKRDIDEANGRAQQALTKARDEESAARQAQQNMQDLVHQREDAAAVAEAERVSSQEQYNELQAESARLADELRAQREQNQGPPSAAEPPRSDGRLSQPVSGWKSSDFGNRYDPYYGVWQLHAGADFAAPGGAPISAAESGRVIRTGWNGGYGNYTCIYHGENSYRGSTVGLSTCYAHQSAIVVSPGQWVNRGDLIGRVGTTGASTGNHLHFEVRVDGDPVDPMGWL